MKELTSVLLAVVVMAILFNYFYKNMYLTKVKSNVDQRTYIVRKLPDKQEAADKLAHLSQKLTNLVNNVFTKDKQKEGVEQLKNKFNSRNITENTPGGKYTAYSVNKGEELAICLRNVKDDTFIDDNLVIFVSIHELAHVMTDEIGHTPKFWDNMRYLLEHAHQTGIYFPEDYSKHPKMYCGQEINSTPYKF
tara:strand:- start:1836 stop:2411 length:576 start_codon:yes stop_codon:yes gene_type:complete